jgi:DNA processing protein
MMTVSERLSANTAAILMLMAPLNVGRTEQPLDLLMPAEYKKLARHLRELGRQPADLLAPDASGLIADCAPVVAEVRLRNLLGRGLLLGQAASRWMSRSIWVMSRADPEYPLSLKKRLKEEAPPLLYGCGDRSFLDNGGLAVVGSRKADDAALCYAREVGRIAASADRTVVSGGARGIDREAMTGALEREGHVIGVLGDGLERASLQSDNRRHLQESRLVLISPYDPAAGFNVGHAMQRNKLIYALADAALVVSVEYEKGGTWNGAVDQLAKRRFGPLYVRDAGDGAPGPVALRRLGARVWPGPQTPDDLKRVFVWPLVLPESSEQSSAGSSLPLTIVDREVQCEDNCSKSKTEEPTSSQVTVPPDTPAEVLLATVRSLLIPMETPKTVDEVAADLNVTKPQAKQWLDRLVEEGDLDKPRRSARYRSLSTTGRLL